MKKLYTLIALMALICAPLNAQTTINYDPDSTEGTGGGGGWLGFMNVFETPANGGGFVFGSGWGVGDLIVVNNMDGTANLLPNRIGDPDPFWQGPGPVGNPTGNKIMEATYYIEDDNLAGTDFTFNAEILSNTLDATGILDYGFTVTAFIKVFAPDYSSNVVVDSYGLAAGNFTLTHDSSDSTVGDHIQYGFTVSGPNVRLNTDVDPNPGFYDDDYAALGSIVVGPNTTLSTSDFEVNEFNVFPNPATDNWAIRSNQQINNIQIYDMLGKLVTDMDVQNNEVRIDASTLNSGIYFARIDAVNGKARVKLVKK